MIALVVAILASNLIFPGYSIAAQEPNLKFTKMVHNADLMNRIENKNLSFLAFPAFMKAPGSQVLEISSDFSDVGLFTAQQPFAPLIRLEKKFVTIGGTCTSYFMGSSSCDSLVFFQHENNQPQVTKLSQATGLDQHDLFAANSNSYWGIRYSIKDCQENLNLCGGSQKRPETQKFADCEVINFNQKGQILNSWSAAESLPWSEVLWDYWKDDIFQGNFVDPFHCNSIDVNRTSKKLLISMRHTNSIYAVDIAKKKVEWKIGGNYLRGQSLESKNPSLELVLGGQHDARWVSPTSISLLDNATNTGKPARGLLVSIHQQNYRILGVFEDPTKSESQCTGSFRRFNSSGEAFFIAGWGCSKNGAAIFTSRGKPIVSIMLDNSKNTAFFRWPPGPQEALNGVLSYRVYPFIR